MVKNRKNVGYFTIEVWWPVVFNEPLCAAIVNNETVRGVDFESFIREIYSRVSPSACTRDEFVSWLVRGAPMFAATGVPNVDMDDDEACRQREFRHRASIAEWSSPLNAAESSFFTGENCNAVQVAAKALDASDDDLREALEDVETAARGGAKWYYKCRGCYLYRKFPQGKRSYPHVSREGKSPTPMAMAVESYGYFLPAKCGNGVSQGKRRFRPHGDGGGRVCDACYKSAWRAKQPAFTCRKCGTKIAPGKRSYPHGEGGGGRMCNACGQRALRAKQQKR